MSAAGQRRRRRKRDHHDAGHENDERWLLTYSDMITLLMALFIILWAISSVNQGKFDELRKSLAQAFNGKILPTSTSILEGSQAQHAVDPVREAAPPVEATPENPLVVDAAAARREQENLRRLKERLDAYAGARGLSGKIHTSIEERGLVIRILPDDMLFNTGEAALRPEARPVLDKVASILRSLDAPNPIRVEGNTDSVPISTSRFRNNWELSTARAVTVLTVIVEDGIEPSRLSATGYADQRPVASNSTPGGRALNRRVEVVVARLAAPPGEAKSSSESGPLVDIVGDAFDFTKSEEGGP